MSIDNKTFIWACQKKSTQELELVKRIMLRK